MNHIKKYTVTLPNGRVIEQPDRMYAVLRVAVGPFGYQPDGWCAKDVAPTLGELLATAAQAEREAEVAVASRDFLRDDVRQALTEGEVQ